MTFATTDFALEFKRKKFSDEIQKLCGVVCELIYPSKRAHHRNDWCMEALKCATTANGNALRATSYKIYRILLAYLPPKILASVAEEHLTQCAKHANAFIDENDAELVGETFVSARKIFTTLIKVNPSAIAELANAFWSMTDIWKLCVQKNIAPLQIVEYFLVMVIALNKHPKEVELFCAKIPDRGIITVLTATVYLSSERVSAATQMLFFAFLHNESWDDILMCKDLRLAMRNILALLPFWKLRYAEKNFTTGRLPAVLKTLSSAPGVPPEMQSNFLLLADIFSKQGKHPAQTMERLSSNLIDFSGDKDFMVTLYCWFLRDKRTQLYRHFIEKGDSVALQVVQRFNDEGKATALRTEVTTACFGDLQYSFFGKCKADLVPVGVKKSSGNHKKLSHTSSSKRIKLRKKDPKEKKGSQRGSSTAHRRSKQLDPLLKRTPSRREKIKEETKSSGSSKSKMESERSKNRDEKSRTKTKSGSKKSPRPDTSKAKASKKASKSKRSPRSESPEASAAESISSDDEPEKEVEKLTEKSDEKPVDNDEEGKAEVSNFWSMKQEQLEQVVTSGNAIYLDEIYLPDPESELLEDILGCPPKSSNAVLVHATSLAIGYFNRLRSFLADPKIDWVEKDEIEEAHKIMEEVLRKNYSQIYT
eukprot:TRINITY_DN6675_c0_g1_i1.p1 TRINITY_DN6675_c0_g1~~TRINITY_DN6675_c0_g1_i1.p1  ORF type:complete len:718 (-),score=130.51 TRINITY_DN6675_c0_g1_i1:300-2246(-)